MPYATAADLAARLDAQLLIELSDDNNDVASDAGVIDALLADASSEIDLFLACRYTTPLENPPAVLKRLCADIAIHGLFARRRSAISPEHATRYAAAIRALGEIAAGRLSLPAVASRPASHSTRDITEGVFSSNALDEY